MMAHPIPVARAVRKHSCARAIASLRDRNCSAVHRLPGFYGTSAATRLADGAAISAGGGAR